MDTFEQVLDVVGPELGSEGRVYSSDGRFGFFFPGRNTSKFPQRCEDLQGHRIFVLLTDPRSRALQARATATPADPSFWTSCTTPAVTEVARVSSYVILRIAPAVPF
jgi:hypothetical protein